MVESIKFKEIRPRLTNIEIISYLLTNLEFEDKGMGTIRTNEKCSLCQQPFTHVRKLGFLCTVHKTTPKRVYIDLFWQGQRVRIFSDKQGQPLDSYQRAFILYSRIQYEIESHIFDPTKYIKTEQEKFWTSNLLDKFLSDKIGSIAPSYKKDYTRIINIAKDFFKIKDVREIRKIDLLNYKEHIEKKFSLADKSVKNILDLFKTFLRYCKNDLEVIDNVPAFPEVETSEHNFKWLSQENQITLFEFIPGMHRPIIAFLMLHGSRPSEARALKCKDVDLRINTITISATFSGRVYREKRKGKKSKSVTIPIHSELVEFIADKVKNNLPESFLFTNPNTGRYYTQSALDRVWNGVRKKAGIKDLRLYDATRHSFASQLVNSGTSLFKVSKLLGHSSVKMTEKYAHQNIESLKSDINKLSLKKKATVSKLSIETAKAIK